MIDKVLKRLEDEFEDIIEEEINSVEDELRCSIDKLINDQAYEIAAEFHKRIAYYGDLKSHFDEEELGNEMEHKIRERLGML